MDTQTLAKLSGELVKLQNLKPHCEDYHLVNLGWSQESPFLKKPLERYMRSKRLRNSDISNIFTDF